MRRRDFIAALGGAAVAMPLAVRAQEGATRTIGWLNLRSANTNTDTSILAALRQGLNQTGYVEGKNLKIESRFGEGQYDRLPALAAELVRRQVEVLVTGGGTPVARVAQAARRQQSPSFLQPPAIPSKTASLRASTGRMVTALECMCSTLR